MGKPRLEIALAILQSSKERREIVLKQVWQKPGGKEALELNSFENIDKCVSLG